MVGGVVLLAVTLHRTPRSKPEFPLLPDEAGRAADSLEDVVDKPRPERLRLAPEYGCWPLWDDVLGVPLGPEDLWLTGPLLARIEAWEATFQATFTGNDPLRSGFADVAAERAWVAEGKAIATELAHEWSGPLVVRLSLLDGLIEQAARDRVPGQAISFARAAEIAPRCGVAEIEKIVERLDKLAQEKDALPDWDGDSQDDVARAQSFFAHMLAAVPERYAEDVRCGLQSPELQTRIWVGLALDWREEIPRDRG